MISCGCRHTPTEAVQDHVKMCPVAPKLFIILLRYKTSSLELRGELSQRFLTYFHLEVKNCNFEGKNLNLAERPLHHMILWYILVQKQVLYQNKHLVLIPPENVQDLYGIIGRKDFGGDKVHEKKFAYDDP
jgi:hypothetical protein